MNWFKIRKQLEAVEEALEESLSEIPEGQAEEEPVRGVNWIAQLDAEFEGGRVVYVDDGISPSGHVRVEDVEGYKLQDDPEEPADGQGFWGNFYDQAKFIPMRSRHKPFHRGKYIRRRRYKSQLLAAREDQKSSAAVKPGDVTKDTATFDYNRFVKTPPLQGG